MSTRNLALHAVAGLVLLLSVPAHASVITFAGIDAGANSTDPHPNANAAAASFDAAVKTLGPEGIIDFESAALGAFSDLEAAPGVTVSGSDFYGKDQTIRNRPASQPDRLFGYNTTVGGSQFVFVQGGTLTFTFNKPVSAFGAYLTGVQDDGETIAFNDGSGARVLAIPNPGIGLGGAEFFGFTDAGRTFSSLVIDTNLANGGADFIGVDDVRYAPAPATTITPEPAALLPAGLGLLAVVLGAFRRRTKQG